MEFGCLTQRSFKIYFVPTWQTFLIQKSDNNDWKKLPIADSMKIYWRWKYFFDINLCLNSINNSERLFSWSVAETVSFSQRIFSKLHMHTAKLNLDQNKTNKTAQHLEIPNWNELFNLEQLQISSHLPIKKIVYNLS